MNPFRRRERAELPAANPAATLWRVDQYAGQSEVRVQATQLDTHEPSAARRRGIYAEWVEFLATTETSIVKLDLVSRVPQDLLDAVAGQRGLRKLVVKWGPYRDLSALSTLPRLEDLALLGATGVASLEPLASMPTLSQLTVSQAKEPSTSALARMVHLRELCVGNAYPGSDRSVVLPDLRWVVSLVELKHLDLPGTRILDPDLSPLLELPGLEGLRLPLRRSYRKQVFDFASRSPVFAAVASDYEEYDAFVASTSHG
ncbi:hypothetical protein [Microbacterium sp. NPDC056057]|uniref:hypothetical protein n=1 Tax=Microbacterium sp. NPDC056057 TaxID=3345699 RepID=UPI0035DE3DA7